MLAYLLLFMGCDWLSSLQIFDAFSGQVTFLVRLWGPPFTFAGVCPWAACGSALCAGKLMHDGANQLSGSDYSLVDYNRAGVPLLEVVSEPDMRSGAEAAAYASELRRTMCFMGLTEGIMAQGHMRFDVNVSVSTLLSQPGQGPEVDMHGLTPASGRVGCKGISCQGNDKSQVHACICMALAREDERSISGPASQCVFHLLH